MRKLQLMIVEDDHEDQLIIESCLREARLVRDVHKVSSLAEAVEHDGLDLDAILLDLNLPDSRHLATLTGIRSRFPGVPVVIMTDVEDMGFALDCIRRGASDYLPKSAVAPEVLFRVITYAIQRNEGVLAMQARADRYRELVERSGAGLFIVNTTSGWSDGSTRVLEYANARLGELLGVDDVDGLVTDPRDVIERVHPHDLADLFEVGDPGTAGWRGRVRIQRDDEWVPLDIAVARHVHHDGERILGVVAEAGGGEPFEEVAEASDPWSHAG